MPDPRVVTAATNQLNPISSTRCQRSTVIEAKKVVRELLGRVAAEM
jgi:hypothetical protein